MFSHVGQQVGTWLHPFSNEQYNKTPGGSWQLVTGIFGLASGGMLGTGLGQGHPSLVARLRTPISSTPLWARKKPV